MNKEEYYQSLIDAIVSGDSDEAAASTERGLGAGLNPMDLINHGIVIASDKLGDLFQNGEVFLPELVMGGNAAKTAIKILLPLIGGTEEDQFQSVKVVLGTVSGDLHDIGKNLVNTMLSARGIEVFDIGVNAKAKTFIEKAEEVDANIIGLSALMSTSLYFQRDVIDHLNSREKRDKYYVIIGGGPVTPEWAREIAADGVGRTAADAVELCVRLLTEQRRPPLPAPIVLPATGW